MLSAVVERYSLEEGGTGLTGFLLPSAGRFGDPSWLLRRRLFYDFKAHPRFDTASTHSGRADRYPRPLAAEIRQQPDNSGPGWTADLGPLQQLTMLRFDHLAVIAPTSAVGVERRRACLDLEMPFERRRPFGPIPLT